MYTAKWAPGKNDKTNKALTYFITQNACSTVFC